MDKIRVEEFIGNGATVENLNSVLTQMFIADDKAKWIIDRQAEYEALYPPFRAMTDDEKAEYGESDSYPLIPLHYDVTFEDWLNETKVVKEAVLDDDGNILEPEVTGLIREFTPKPSYKDEIDNYFASSNAWKVRLKKEKQEAIAILTVTTKEGNTFDATDQARANMNEAIAAASILGLTENDWKLANNIIITVTVDEIKEALAMGIQAKGSIILGVDE